MKVSMVSANYIYNNATTTANINNCKQQQQQQHQLHQIQLS